MLKHRFILKQNSLNIIIPDKEFIKYFLYVIVHALEDHVGNKLGVELIINTFTL